MSKEYRFTDKEMFRALFDNASIKYQVSKNMLALFSGNEGVVGCGGLDIRFDDEGNLKEFDIWGW